MVAVVGVTVAIFWMTWTLVYEAISSILRPFALNYLLAGVWYLGGTLSAYIVRKPGAAIFGELTAAAVEMTLTHWGFIALLWGLVQGIAVEFVFFLLGYREWGKMPFLVAGALAGVAAFALDYFFYSYQNLANWYIIAGIVNSAIGGAIGSGLLAVLIGRALESTGALDTVKTGRK